MHIKKATPHIGSNRRSRRAAAHKAHTGSKRPDWKKAEITVKKRNNRKEWRNA